VSKSFTTRTGRFGSRAGAWRRAIHIVTISGRHRYDKWLGNLRVTRRTLPLRDSTAFRNGLVL
jgi:hypothetical protein